ncbi:c-type cytochrome biogenesis protein CcmI [Aliigemmobacter aestuarii]|uniref:C-type cytochrome biogenesis protein CcmI n=1 Tax=Aliigemmobacter aestuarii TaxID=1445661 RepID=A0A4S3MPZ7_9RHOB|nr:c-type cytochrome biogenesis protein CcmI [Gemmobacter aestuarii]THD84499.1 c-type cytochrome biogenesis protein CcmI [Gemmobacter aestuarii]
MPGTPLTMFWLVAAALAVAVAGILYMAFRRATLQDDPAAAYDLRVYRDQLAEVDRDLARGVLGAEDAERMRTEISRRVLEADRAVKLGSGAAANASAGGRAVLIGLTALAVLGSFALYARIGAPGYPDMPLKDRLAMADELRSTRPAQDVAEADAAPAIAAMERPTPDAAYLELVDKLRAAVAERPNDIQGQELLARNEAALGNFRAAYEAQRQIIALKDPRSTAEDHAILAELMILAAGGYISPEAEVALTEALRRDPENGTALYYSGLMFAQTGRPDMAFRIWRPLLERSAPDAPWVPPLRAQIENMAALAGIDYVMPPAGAAPGAAVGAMPGPTAEDMEAAAGMSDEDRQAMIRGMVEGLNDRLASEGGTAQEWARLIGALGTLGETDRARAIWTEAQGRFAERPEDLALVRAAAEQAGVAE